MTKQELANRLKDLHEGYVEAYNHSRGIEEKLYHTSNMLAVVIGSLQLYLEGKIE